MNKFYITTPIYYPSDKFHIGHSYTTISADAIARFKKLEGKEVFFQTGTDEHGTKIEQKAKEHNMEPKEYIDNIILDAKDLWEKLNIKYDYFIRTTDEFHVKRVQEIFKKLYKKGDIYKSVYKGLYCVPCESFWTEKELIDGMCPDCNREVKIVEEEAYFFKMSKYEKRLKKLYKDNPDFILPISRKNELLNNFINPGLEDLCVTRTSVDWGIKVPFDKKHTIYVWIDALSNYITSLGYPDDLELFNKYWPADIHLVGKEITRFHAIIWPILLMALEIDLPKKIFAHGWLVIDGSKISKSIGNYEDPRTYIDKYGVDAVRYYVLKEVPFGNDGNFSIDSLIKRTNADLVNNIGNLVTRTVSMSLKYFDGKIEYKKVDTINGKELISKMNTLYENIKIKMEELKINEALDYIIDLAHTSNKYIDLNEPWLLAKEESKKEELETVLYNLLESIKSFSIILQPFLPDLSNNILENINVVDRKIENAIYSDQNKYNLKEQRIIYQRIDSE